MVVVSIRKGIPSNLIGLTVLPCIYQFSERTGPGPHCGSGFGAIAGLQLEYQIVAVEAVVAQHQGRGPIRQEIRPDQEGLGQAIGTGLDGVLDRQAQG